MELDRHIEAERGRHSLTPREIGFIERAWKAARSGERSMDARHLGKLRVAVTTPEGEILETRFVARGRRCAQHGMANYGTLEAFAIHLVDELEKHFEVEEE